METPPTSRMRNSSLMRAHAALQRLEQLKADSLLHPIELEGPLPQPRSARRSSEGRDAQTLSDPSLATGNMKPAHGSGRPDRSPSCEFRIPVLRQDSRSSPLHIEEDEVDRRAPGFNTPSERQAEKMHVTDDLVSEAGVRWSHLGERGRQPAHHLVGAPTSPTASAPTSVPRPLALKPSENPPPTRSQQEFGVQVVPSEVNNTSIDEAVQTDLRTPTTPAGARGSEATLAAANGKLQSEASQTTAMVAANTQTHNRSPTPPRSPRAGRKGSFSALLSGASSAALVKQQRPSPGTRSSRSGASGESRVSNAASARQRRADISDAGMHHSRGKEAEQPESERAAARAMVEKARPNSVLNRMLEEISLLRSQQVSTMHELSRLSAASQAVLDTSPVRNGAGALSASASMLGADEQRFHHGGRSSASDQQPRPGDFQQKTVASGESTSSNRVSPSVAVGRRSFVSHDASTQQRWSSTAGDTDRASRTRNTDERGRLSARDAALRHAAPLASAAAEISARSAASARAPPQPTARQATRPTRTSADARRILKERDTKSGPPEQQGRRSASGKGSVDARLQDSPARSKVAQYDYSRTRLREHEKRRRAYLQALEARHEHIAEGRFEPSHHPRPGPAAIAHAPSRSASQRRTRSNTPAGAGGGHPDEVSPYRFWAPPKNRHVPGGSRWTPNDGPQKLAAPVAQRRTSRSEGFLSPAAPRRLVDATAVDVSPLSDDFAASPPSPPQSAIIRGGVELADASLSTTHRMVSQLAGHQSNSPPAPAPASPRWASLPLMPYLLQLRSGSDIEGSRAELRRCAPLANVADVASCRFWLALTQLANQPNVLEHVVVPLILTELRYVDENGENDSPSSRLSQLLCALIGLGRHAAAALDHLMRLMRKGLGDQRLVGLAIRAVGGERGVRQLVEATEANDEQLVSTAMYSLSLLSDPIKGHTTVLCIGSERMQNKISYFQPAVAAANRFSDSQTIAGASTGAGTRKHVDAIVQHQPPYRLTFVVLDVELMAGRIEKFMASPQYRPGTTPYPLSGVVLLDFLDAAPALVEQLPGLPEGAARSLQCVADDVAASGGCAAAQREALNAESLCVDGGLTREHSHENVTVALMQVLHAPSLSQALKQQALLAIAALPSFLAHRTLGPLLRFTTDEVLPTGDSGVELLALACVCLGRVAQDNSEEPAAVADCCAFLTEALSHDSPKVGLAAVVALGTIGPPAAAAAASALHQGLLRGTLHPESTSWSLALLGRPGVAALVKTMESEQLEGPVIVSAVRALVAVAAQRVPPVALDTHLLDVVCSRLVQCAIARGKGSSVTGGGEATGAASTDVAIACVETLCAIAEELLPLRRPPAISATQEAVSYYATQEPNPLVQMLCGIVEVAPAAEVTAACCAGLANHGGAHGEVQLTRWLLESESRTIKRAAAKVVKLLGAKAIRTIALSLNDEDQEVVTEMVGAIGSIGIESIAQLLLHERPPEHIAQVHRCCADYLQQHHNDSVVRALFAALQQQS